MDAAHGVTEGSKVAVHYTVEGGKETAHEVDKIGDDGLKTTDGTVSHIDRGAKTIAVKTSDGTEQTFHLTDRAAKDTGKDVAEGADKSAKVTVYYTAEEIRHQDSCISLSRFSKVAGTRSPRPWAADGDLGEDSLPLRYSTAGMEN